VSTAFEFIQPIQDGTLDTVETIQRWTAEALRGLTATFDGFTAGGSVIPIAGGWPTPEEALSVTFGFAERLLAINRRFVSDLMALASTPAASPAAGHPGGPPG
jgi:hypothetical protein